MHSEQEGSMVVSLDEVGKDARIYQRKVLARLRIECQVL
jgi:hypothetical protein